MSNKNSLLGRLNIRKTEMDVKESDKNLLWDGVKICSLVRLNRSWPGGPFAPVLPLWFS
jgi:hypothetical protein